MVTIAVRAYARVAIARINPCAIVCVFYLFPLVFAVVRSFVRSFVVSRTRFGVTVPTEVFGADLKVEFGLGDKNADGWNA